MAISSAIKGAVVPASELNSSGLNLNDLVNQGVISPREGGQSFEFLQPWSAGSGLPSPASSGTPGTNFDISQFLPQGFASSFDFNTQLQEMLAQSKPDTAATSGVFDANRLRLEEERRAALQEGETVGAKELGATEFSSKKMTGGEMGFSSMEKSLIDNQISRNEKRLNAIKAEYDKALLDNDTNKVAALDDQRQQYVDNLMKIDTMVTNRLVQAFTMNMQTKQFEESQKQFNLGYNLELQQMGISQDQFNQNMTFNQSQFEESKRQFGESQALEKWKTQISQNESAADREIQFQTLLNNTPAGQPVSIKLPDGTTKTGVGRFKYASSGGGGGGEETSDLSKFTDEQMKAFLEADPNNPGKLRVNEALIIEAFGAKDKSQAIIKANEAMNRMNNLSAEEASQQINQATKSLKEQGLGVWGTGAKSRAGAVGKIITEIPSVGSEVVGGLVNWLFGS